MIKKIQYGHSYYEGNVVNGKFHGKGIYFWNNGDRYEGECTFEHVGQWYDGKRHGVFERYKNTGDWENLELYSFDVYQYGNLIDRFYITDLEEKGVYNKIQFINYYSKLQLKKFIC